MLLIWVLNSFQFATPVDEDHLGLEDAWNLVDVKRILELCDCWGQLQAGQAGGAGKRD